MTSPAALQRKLPILDDHLLVLATISAARAKLPGHDEDDILALIEDGYLLAFNIALQPPPLMARELRILPPSLDLYARQFSKTPVRAFAHTWPRVLLAGEDKPFLFAPTVALMLTCSPTHVTNLIDAGLLRQLDGTRYSRGPNGAACILRESFLGFLKSRLEGGL